MGLLNFVQFSTAFITTLKLFLFVVLILLETYGPSLDFEYICQYIFKLTV